MRLFRQDAPAKLLFVGLMGFIGEHADLGAAGTSPFLATDFFYPGPFGGHITLLSRLNLVEHQPAGDEPVQPLLPGGLTFDLQTGRTMQQHHAGGRLVDILTAMAAGADKGFLQIGFAHA